MLIVGAGGFAKEVLEVIHRSGQLENLVFYDDVNEDVKGKLFGKFPILKNIKDAEEYFLHQDNRFTIGVGGPEIRGRLFEKFSKIGGKFTSTISETASIGSYGNQIGEGCNIMVHVAITNNISIGKGVIVNQLTSIGHDVTIGDFSEICPSVSISGHCSIGEKVFIGTGAIILPNLSIGNNVVVAAGAVVRENVEDNTLVAGIPAVVKKHIR